MKYIRIFLVVFPVLLHADKITIFNQTNQPLYFAPYSVNDTAKQVGQTVLVGPDQTLQIQRPEKIKDRDRQLAFSFSKDAFKPEFEKKRFYTEIASKNIGAIQGSRFYIATKKDRLVGYNAAQWKVEVPLRKGAEKIKEVTKPNLSFVRKQLAKELRVVRENPYKETVAKVRTGTNVSPQEKQYITKRMPKVKKALEAFLGMPLDGKYIPKIAIIGSGGGYRAMLWSLGQSLGAQQAGLLDAVTYIVGLSGSTWFIGSWMQSELPIATFKEMIFGKLGKGFGPVPVFSTVPFLGLAPFTKKEANLMAKPILTKFAMNQPITIVDFYGALLANRLFANRGDKRQAMHLSEQQKFVQDGNWPFPIYTTVQVAPKSSAWFEFNPFEAGSTSTRIWTPTWAFNRRFKNGTSQNFAPEQSFGYLLGACGSAFAANFMQIYQEVKKYIDNKMFKQVIDMTLRSIGTRQLIKGAKVFNPAFQISGVPTSDQEVVQLVDAGLAFNLPYPPVSGQAGGRSADILIFLDASESIYEAHQLKRAEQYARANKLKFPKIDYAGIDKKAISIFKNEKDPSVPIVIYMPRIKERRKWDLYKDQAGFMRFAEFLPAFDPDACIKTGFCATGNFSYSPKQAQQLIALGEFNMLASKEEIKEAIRWKIENR